MSNKKVVLITGCSSGFGYLSALKFAKEGWIVIASVRHINDAHALQNAAKSKELHIDILQIDVTKDDEVQKEVTETLRRYEKIDVLVNNAGFGFNGPIEDFAIDEVQELYDVNVYGALRMIKAVLPSMRKRKSGTIINITSINGLLSFGLFGIYSSSKFALETISEALRFEVQPFNVKVSIVEPGAFLTNFHENGKQASKYRSGDTAYKGLKNPLDDSEKGKLKDNSFIKRFLDPQIVADKIYEVAMLENPRIRYKVGIDTKVYTFIRKIAPQWLWDWATHKAYKW